MRKFNKIKLLTSLSSIGLVATSVPVIATSCTTTSLYGPNPNDETIEISQIRWIKQKIYNFNTESEIIAKVKKDNRYIYSNYPGLEEATTVSATFNSSSNEIDITIAVTDFEQTKYIQSGEPVSWSATYVSPTPTVKTDINTLNWYLRGSYDPLNTTTQALDKSLVVATIKSDNEGTSGAQISDWDKISINVEINGGNISISVVANNDNPTYSGCVRWAATLGIQGFITLTSTVFNYGSIMASRQNNQVILQLWARPQNQDVATGTYTLGTAAGTVFAPARRSTGILVNYETSTVSGFAKIEDSGIISVIVTTAIAKTKQTIFTLSYIAAN